MAPARAMRPTILAAGLWCALAAPAQADQPVPWQLGLQPSASPIMDSMAAFHDLLLIFCVAITGFVLALLIYVMVRFRASANPVPSRTSHHTVIEVLWTVVPVLILVVIAVPSFRLLYAVERIPAAGLTIKAIGHQWYWTYEYPDHKFGFDALLVEAKDLKPGQPRLLETDNHVVVPVDTVVRVQVTADDVLHAWAVPALAVKIDAVPGRLNETWFRASRAGVFYGQCSELCGVNHGFMPITVKAVAKDEFARWAAARKKAAEGGGPGGAAVLTAAAGE
jgi:cytochrome c oxidase subunit II